MHAPTIDLHAGQLWANDNEEAHILALHMGKNGVLVAEFRIRTITRIPAGPWSTETYRFIEPHFRQWFPRYR